MIVIVKCVRKGEIYYADLAPVKGSEQGGVRPVLVIQNDIGNKYIHQLSSVYLLLKRTNQDIPTHVFLGQKFGLPKESFGPIRTNKNYR